MGKTIRILLAAWLAAGVLLGAPGGAGLVAATVGPANDPPPGPTDAAYAPGELLVGVHRDALPSSPKARAAEDALARITALAEIAVGDVTLLDVSDATDAPVYLRVSVTPGQEWAAIARLAGEPSIASAEPNWLAYAAAVRSDDAPTPVLPSDPLFRSNQWGMQRIGASRAWAINQGSALRVAVIDSGIDFNHSEFAGRTLAGKNYVTPSATAQDDSGHGTHVAGIIGATLNNSIGVAGVAPKVLLDPYKVLNNRNNGVSANIAQAIRDATDAGARIINLSLTLSESSSAVESAVNYAVGKGVLLVGAAGNSAPNPVWWPAAYTGVLAVAATDRTDQRTYYSHTGAVDLAAPGGLSDQLIYSTWPAGIPCGTPTLPGYCTAIGTSMSAAYVSGVAALVWATRPDLTLVQVRNLLLETARKTGAPSSELGAGRVDAHAAVRQALLSDLRLSRSRIAALSAQAAQPYTTSLTLENPSGELIFWQASVTGGSQWLSLGQAAGRANASIRYGEPAQVSVVISPTHLAPGDHSGALTVVGTRSNGSKVNLPVPVDLFVRSTLHTRWLGQTSRLSAPLVWHAPNEQGKQPVQLSDSSTVGLLLPFTFTVESQAVTTVRLYADGFLTFPASDSVTSLPVACAPDETPAQQAIYGWWSDLNPALGGSVSTFTSTAGAFVVEFLDVPLAANSGAQVRMQMALYANGRVELSYAKVPEVPGDVVVGMEVNQGLLSTRIACRKGSVVLGALPAAGETITIQPTDWR